MRIQVGRIGVDAGPRNLCPPTGAEANGAAEATRNDNHGSQDQQPGMTWHSIHVDCLAGEP